MWLTPSQLETATSYNEKEAKAGRLTPDQLTLAVAAVQAGEGLVVDGMAGPATREVLDSFASPQACPVTPGLPYGKGMFVRSLSHTGEPEDCVEQMRAAGLTWVCVQRIWQYEGDQKTTLLNGPRMADYANAVHAAGFGFWVWGYPTPGKEDEFAAEMFWAVDEASAQGIVIDPEKPYIGTEGAGLALMQALMPGCVRRQILLGLTSYGSPWYFESFPWREFASCHFALPQIYDPDNDQGEDYPTRSEEAYRDLGFGVLIPASAAYGKTEEQMGVLLENTPTPQNAILWWDWYNATSVGLWGPIADMDLGVSREEEA